MKGNPLLRYYIALSITLAVFAASFIAVFISVFAPELFHAAQGFITVIFFAVSLSTAIIAVFTFLFINAQLAMFKQLKSENIYTLGHESYFFNLSAFQNRVLRLRRNPSLHFKKQYLVAFSATSTETSYNILKTDASVQLNYEISNFIDEKYSFGKGLFSLKTNVFGFNRGVFFIYMFGVTEEEVKNVATELTNKVFEIVKEKDLKIWAQPFFGVTEVEPDENLTGAIENALIARSNGEANFESFVKYTKKEKIEHEDDLFEEINYALEHGEFVPYYQLKYNLKKKEIVSCEALARWNSPKRGLLTPGTFVERAEELGLLSSIDIYIFEAAIRDVSNALKRGRRVVPVSCNFSLYEFFSHTFIDTIMNLLNKYQVPTSLVEIEITETTSQVNQFLSVSVIKKLKDTGIRVLMDDYGVGYSQISNLKNIPFDAIKIDKSYIDLILTDVKTKSIVKFLIDLGHVNGMEVIAEGVEKKEQVEALRRMGIDTIQGFYYSKAVSIDDFQALLKENTFEGGNQKWLSY